MPTRPLFAQGSATLDANGFASIRFQPTNESWEITSCSVTARVFNGGAPVAPVLEAQSKNYLNFVGDAYYVDGTYTGSSGDTSDTVVDVLDGQGFIVEWYGGDPGATASVTIRGTATFRETGGFRVS